MKVSPLDLRQLRFKIAFRGFDRAEVAALLAEVADDYERALLHADKLRQQVAALEALLNEHREQERDLRNTLMTAQKLSEGIRETAEAQARQIISEAEGRSELLLEKTQARVDDLNREIEGMRLKRREVVTSLESMVATLASSIEFILEQGEREERRFPVRPREGEPKVSTIRQRKPDHGEQS